MKKCIGYVTLFCFLILSVTGCNTNKPADEVKGAQDRVKQKIEGEREKQETENPESQEGSNQPE